MAKLCINPLITIFDSSGNIDEDATIQFFDNGANQGAPKVYTDGALEQAHKNPLDFSVGSTTQLIYGGSGTYRFWINNGTGGTIDGLQRIPTPNELDANLDVATFSIVSTGANDVTFTSGPFGCLIMDGLTWPKTDGEANQIIGTDGAGTLSWVVNGIIWNNDTTPQLGGDLDCNGFDIKFDTGTGIRDSNDNEQIVFRTTASATNYIDITNAATGNDPSITANGSDDNIDLALAGLGIGAVKISGITYPTVDGSEGYGLSTDGAAALTFRNTAAIAQRATADGWNGSLYCPVTTALDDTVPQITEGIQFGSITVTPAQTTSTLHIELNLVASFSPENQHAIVSIFESTQANALATTIVNTLATTSSHGPHLIKLRVEVPSNSTNPRTYTARVDTKVGSPYNVYMYALNSGHTYGKWTIDEITV